MSRTVLVALFGVLLLPVPSLMRAQTINLPSSKALIGEIPGHPRRLNSEPVSMAISPDGRYVVTVNDGYGTYESEYYQSLAVLDTQTGTLTDFPEKRTGMKTSQQTLFSGLAFSRDGREIYASMASLTDPTGARGDDTGSGILVYRFADGRIAPDRLIRLPLQQLAPGRVTQLPNNSPSNKGIPYPAAIAVIGVPGAEKLLIADNLSDDVLLIDAASGKIEARFDLSQSDAVPSTYPIALQVSKDGRRAFVALWNASEIVELNLAANSVGRKLALLRPDNPLAPGTHPSAFVLSPDERTLYVALANRDTVAAVNVAGGRFSVKGYFDTRLPHQSYFGAEPVALALNVDGSRLFAANMAADAVAVIDTRKLTAKAAKAGMVEPDGFIPTEWMPISLAFLPPAFQSSSGGGTLYVASDKSKGAGPNNFPQRPAGALERSSLPHGGTYVGTLLYGSLASIPASSIPGDLQAWTANTILSNRMEAAQKTLAFAAGGNPIKHVIYIIKENRTYDQIFGDLEQNGRAVGNGDPALAIYGESITPNQHKFALQYGVLDNFYDSGEVSGEGHVWSNAAIGSDYLEKTWQQEYRGSQRTYDYEGVVADGYPLLQKIPDITDPESGYLWGDLARHGKTYYHFGEFISSRFCDGKAVSNPQLGPMLTGRSCSPAAIRPGQPIPADWGGGTNKWPWAIPLLAGNVATKPELVGHFAPEAPDFNLMIPDQIRVNIFLRHLKNWIADREQGRDTMPAFISLRLPDDHTQGTRPGGPTPEASIADNDLAVGRAIEAVSHSPFWNDTAFFVLEDDAQNGADHVDAHRSIALVVSKYAPHGPGGRPFVDSRFFTTVSMVRTMEMALGLPPMNNDDAFCSVIASLFGGPGDQPPYDADYRNEKNSLIYTANKRNAEGARASMKMDFSHEDRVPVQKLNIILWKDAMGKKPVPAMLRMHARRDKDGDGD